MTGIYVRLMGVTTPVGSFLIGEVAGHFGTGAALVVFGAAPAGGVGLLAALRRYASSWSSRAEGPEGARATAIGAR